MLISTRLVAMIEILIAALLGGAASVGLERLQFFGGQRKLAAMGFDSDDWDRDAGSLSFTFRQDSAAVKTGGRKLRN